MTDDNAGSAGDTTPAGTTSSSSESQAGSSSSSDALASEPEAAPQPSSSAETTNGGSTETTPADPTPASSEATPTQAEEASAEAPAQPSSKGTSAEPASPADSAQTNDTVSAQQPEPQAQAGAASPAPVQSGSATTSAGKTQQTDADKATVIDVGQTSSGVGTGSSDKSAPSAASMVASHKIVSATVTRNADNSDFEKQEAQARELALRAHQNRVVAGLLENILKSGNDETATLFGQDETDDNSNLVERYYAEA